MEPTVHASPGLTPDVLVAAAGSTPFAKSETATQFLQRIQELSLNQRGLVSLEGVELAENVRALYAYQNRLTSLPSRIAALQQLELLVASENQIAELPQGMGSLAGLQRLHLSYNSVASLQGLEGCTALVELSLAFQTISEPLRLPGPALDSMASSLRYLDLRGNRIRYVAPLGLLTRLEFLDLSHNDIRDADCVVRCARERWHQLEALDTRGNPFDWSGTAGECGDGALEGALVGAAQGGLACCGEKRVCRPAEFRDSIIAARGATLRVLDGEELTPLQAAFIARLHARRSRGGLSGGVGCAGEGCAGLRRSGLTAPLAFGDIPDGAGAIHGVPGQRPLVPKALTQAAGRKGSSDGWQCPGSPLAAPLPRGQQVQLRLQVGDASHQLGQQNALYGDDNRGFVGHPPAAAAALCADCRAWATQTQRPPASITPGQWVPAKVPARTPNDFFSSSRFSGSGYASLNDQLAGSAATHAARLAQQDRERAARRRA